EFQPAVIPYVQELFDWLLERKIELFVYADFYQFLQHIGLGERDIQTFQEPLPADIDLMLSLGGDGTMLSAVSLVGDSGIPVAGINFGRLGFLASINKDDIKVALQQIIQ